MGRPCLPRSVRVRFWEAIRAAEAGLSARWSPRQISARLKRDQPGRPELWVSHETICQALYVQGRGALRRELTRCLRTGRALRKPRRQTQARRTRERIVDKV